VTGVLINHAEAFGLPDRPVPAFVAAWYYQGDLARVDGYRINGDFVYGVGDRVYLNDRAVTECNHLEGATSAGGRIVALCNDDLLVISTQGRLLERLGAIHGVPKGIRRLGKSNKRLVLEAHAGVVSFDLDTLAAIPVPGESVAWQRSARVPATLTRPLLADTVSWEQFLLDLHSGRLLGLAGTWFSDIIAVLLIGMALSGVVLWRIPRRSNGNGCASAGAETKSDLSSRG